MKFRHTIVLAALGLLYPCSANASGLVKIADAPGSVPNTTGAWGIGDNGTINGSYVGARDGSLHGFVGRLDGNYRVYDVGSGGTQPRALNNPGWQTGFYNGNNCDPNNSCAEFEVTPSGAAMPITMNGNQLYGIVQGLNSSGVFVGNYHPAGAASSEQANGYYGYQGKYNSDLTLPFPTRQTKPRAINNNGAVVGGFSAQGDQEGFLLSSGQVTVVHYPDPTGTLTFLEGINDQGWIAGQRVDADGNYHSFVLSPDLSSFYDIDVPGATQVQAFAINNSLEVAVTTDIGGYIFCMKDGGACGGPKSNVAPLTTNAARLTFRRATPASTRRYTCIHACRFVGGTPAQFISPRGTEKRAVNSSARSFVKPQ